jgi:predicted ATPase/DNA-binding CsgD family transcriptional regulator/transcriptional regulator with XRE-family HTH domain
MAQRDAAPFGVVLRRFRAAARLTQEELAARASLSPDAVAALERGKRRTPRDTTVELLADALGLEAQERAQLAAAARASWVAPAARPAAGADGGAARDVSHRPWWLAAEPTPLVDRVHELDMIVRSLATGEVRLLTLTGPAGVGKTRLALAAAAQLAEGDDRFRDGVTLVDLAPVRDPDLVLDAIEWALGLLGVGGRSALERLAEAVGDQRQLLVLDNFEQVLPAAASLSELLAACAGLAMLVTSRVPLRLRWEQTLRVAPLPVPDPTQPLPPLEDFVAIPSVALFVQRARAREVDFVLSERQAPAVARLVAQLDGLPLALELAAARTGALAVPVIAHRLGDRLRLLRWEAADAPERQRSLEAAVGWSYDLLGEEERRLFRCLGVFASRVSLAAIAAVAGVVAGKNAVAAGGEETGRALTGLLSLAEQSLILPARGGWQEGEAEDADEDADEDANPELAFRMLETVREYAAERLAAEGELDTARLAHARYFLALAERAPDPTAAAWAYTYLGLGAVTAGDVAAASDLLGEARRRWEALGNPHGLGETHFFLGVAADLMGDVAAASHYSAALQQLETVGDAQGAAYASCYLGVAEWKRRELASAVEHIRAGLRTGVVLQDRWLLGAGAQVAVALVSERADPAARARLLGVPDALKQATGATFAWVRMPGGRDVVGLRERLAREGEEGEWAAAYREGRSLRFSAAATLALTLLDDVAQTLAGADTAPVAASLQLGRQPAQGSHSAAQSPLSEREAEVLRLVAQGLSSKAIARQLILSPSTVNQHVKSIFNKLGVDTRAQAVAVAVQRGLL